MMKLSKLEYVQYIQMGAAKLTELQKGVKTYTHQKFLLRKAAQEVLGISYQKALNFAVDLLSPIGDDHEKAAKRFKAEELDRVAKHFDSEIRRVSEYQAEKEEKVERTVFFSEQEKNHHDRMKKVEEAKAALANEREQAGKDHSVDWEEVERPQAVAVEEKKSFETLGGLNRSLQSTLGKHYKLSKFIQDSGLSFYSLFDEVRISYTNDLGKAASIDEKVMEHLGAYNAKVEFENKGNSFEKRIITVTMEGEDKTPSTYTSYEDGDSYISMDEATKVCNEASSRTGDDIKSWVVANAAKILWHQDNITYRIKTMIAIFQGEKTVNDYGISQLVTLFFEAKKELNRLVDIGGGR